MNPSVFSMSWTARRTSCVVATILKHAENYAASAAVQAELAGGLTPADLWAAPFVLKALADGADSESVALRSWAAEASEWDALLARSLRTLSRHLTVLASEAQETFELAQGFIAAERTDESARNGAAPLRTNDKGPRVAGRRRIQSR
jgi:hypothetical protein